MRNIDLESRNKQTIGFKIKRFLYSMFCRKFELRMMFVRRHFRTIDSVWFANEKVVLSLHI